MVARPRLTTSLAAGSVATVASLAALAGLTAPAAAAEDSICPATLFPGQLCTTVDTVADPLVPLVPTLPVLTTPTTEPSSPSTTSPPTTAAPEPEPAPSPAPVPALPSSPVPLPSIPLLPGTDTDGGTGPTTPVPSPASPPSNEGGAPAPSPGGGDASPASHPAATSPVVTGSEAARGVDLSAYGSTTAHGSPFVLGPAPAPLAPGTSAAGGLSELAAATALPAARSNLPGDDGGLPRPSGPATLAVLLVAGVLGAHGVRWIDRQTATAATPSRSGT